MAKSKSIPADEAKAALRDANKRLEVACGLIREKTLDSKKLEDIDVRLIAIAGLCFTLADAHDSEAGNIHLVGAFYALGYAVNGQSEALEAVLSGKSGGAS